MPEPERELTPEERRVYDEMAADFTRRHWARVVLSTMGRWVGAWLVVLLVVVAVIAVIAVFS